MLRLLFISLSAIFLCPITARAESHWLVMTWIMHNYGVTSESIEMESAEACAKEGEKWRNSTSHVSHRKWAERNKQYASYHCVVGK